MRKGIKHFILLIIAVIVVWGIATLTEIEVHNENDLRNLSCGWPIEFIDNDQSWRGPYSYPWKIQCNTGQWGDSMVEAGPFVINILIFYLVFLFIWKGVSFALSKIRQETKAGLLIFPVLIGVGIVLSLLTWGKFNVLFWLIIPSIIFEEIFENCCVVFSDSYFANFIFALIFWFIIGWLVSWVVNKIKKNA